MNIFYNLLALKDKLTGKTGYYVQTVSKVKTRELGTVMTESKREGPMDRETADALLSHLHAQKISMED